MPDVLDKTNKVIGEVKNVRRLSFTRQLQDFAAYARTNGYRFELWIRRETRLSGALREAIARGDIIPKYLR